MRHSFDKLVATARAGRRIKSGWLKGKMSEDGLNQQ
jgi:hypothetical protein